MSNKKFNFKTMGDVKKANKENGYKWFSKDKFLLYNVKIETSLLKKGYFIISSKENKKAIKKYSICLITNEKGRIVVISIFFNSLKEAKANIKKYEKETGIFSRSDSWIDWSILDKNDENKYK